MSVRPDVSRFAYFAKTDEPPETVPYAAKAAVFTAADPALTSNFVPGVLVPIPTFAVESVARYALPLTVRFVSELVAADDVIAPVTVSEGVVMPPFESVMLPLDTERPPDERVSPFVTVMLSKVLMRWVNAREVESREMTGAGSGRAVTAAKSI